MEHACSELRVNTNSPDPGKGKKKLTTAERWKKKKESKTPIEEDPNSVTITKLTELANELLTRTGNMDIYQETYEQIKKKVKSERFEQIYTGAVVSRKK